MTSSSSPLSGRGVLVTGASSGIGRATVLALAAQGADVCAAARRLDRLEDLAGQAADLPGRVLPAELDVTDHDAVARVVGRCAEELGGLSAVVANAGVVGGGSVTDADLAAWRRLLDVDVLGVMAVVALALPHLREREDADVVLVGSMTGTRVASPGTPAYAAAKHAVTGFAESLRQEVSPDGVRVTLLQPGFVDTEATAGLDWGEMEPLEAPDVAALVVHALSLPRRVSLSEVRVRPTGQRS